MQVRLRQRLRVQFKENGALVLTKDGERWEKEFPTVFQVLHFVHSLSPDTDVRVTFSDTEGREIIETFI